MNRVLSSGDVRRGRNESIRQILVLLYGFFAFAAGARSLYQLATRFDEAPASIVLSLLAAIVYLVACLQLRRRTPGAWRLAVGATGFELIGVLVVGTLSIVEREWFPLSTVWYLYGRGYGFVPLLLPIAGLTWLTRPRTRRAYGIVPSERDRPVH